MTPEQFGANKKKENSSGASSKQLQGSNVDQLSIENEMNYDLRLPSGKNSKLSRSYDNKSEADSGIMDDRETPQKGHGYNPAKLFQVQD